MYFLNDEDRATVWKKGKRTAAGETIVAGKTGIQVKFAPDLSWRH